MSAAAATHDDAPLPGQSPHGAPMHIHRGPASRRVVVGYGFWIFLLSDIIMFSALFAAYAVLSGATADGPTGKQLFKLGNVAIETTCLLVSSFTCGMCAVALGARNLRVTYLMAALTFLFGAAFLYLEIHEFAEMIAAGAGPQRSAFLSAFFTLVGCHGAHVTLGLVWLLIMMIQVATRGFHPHVLHRLLCFSLFWHALDIIWIGVFSIVYLMGAG